MRKEDEMEAVTELRVKGAQFAVTLAKCWRKEVAEEGYVVGTDLWKVWKEAAGNALAKVGSLLEDALMDGDEAVNELRKRFGLGPMEELPWDGVSELVGWDVVIEKEG